MSATPVTSTSAAKPGREAHGFTLIEVLIVVAIIGILAAIAYPSYSVHVQKTRRSDAHLSLLSQRQAMERCRSTSYTYVGCGIDTASAEDHYTLSVSGRSASAFTLSAVAKGVQLSDERCRTLTIDELDRPKGFDAAAAEVSECWN